MKTHSKRKFKNLAIIVIAVLLCLSTLLTLTLAYFTDSKTAISGGALNFGDISLNPEIKEAPTTSYNGNTVSFTISATEVAGDKAYRTLALNNTTANKTEDFYLRIKFQFINNGALSSLATVGIASDNSYWQKSNSAYKNDVLNFTSENWQLNSNDNKLYYNNKVVMSSGNTLFSQYIPIEITFLSGLTQETLKNAYVKISLEAIQCANNSLATWKSTSSLNDIPKGYTKLEYIEATGAQYINTGYCANNNTRVQMKVALTKLDTSSTLFCSRENERVNSFELHYFGNWIFAARYGTQDNEEDTRLRDFGKPTLDEPILVDFNKNVVSMNNITKTLTTQTFTAPCTMYLFASYNTSAGVLTYMYTYSYAKLYSCSIYDNGTLIRNYVPCQNSLGAVGLYDTVMEEFVTSGSTTSFVAGPVVS